MLLPQRQRGATVWHCLTSTNATLSMCSRWADFSNAAGIGFALELDSRPPTSAIRLSGLAVDLEPQLGLQAWDLLLTHWETWDLGNGSVHLQLMEKEYSRDKQNPKIKSPDHKWLV
eukprot:g40190.t1